MAIATVEPATYAAAIDVLAESHAARTLYGHRDGTTPSGVSIVADIFGVAGDVITRDYEAVAREKWPTSFAG